MFQPLSCIPSPVWSPPPTFIGESASSGSFRGGSSVGGSFFDGGVSGGSRRGGLVGSSPALGSRFIRLSSQVLLRTGRQVQVLRLWEFIKFDDSIRVSG